jgi:hypothetical protein
MGRRGSDGISVAGGEGEPDEAVEKSVFEMENRNIFRNSSGRDWIPGILGICLEAA